MSIFSRVLVRDVRFDRDEIRFREKVPRSGNPPFPPRRLSASLGAEADVDDDARSLSSTSREADRIEPIAQKYRYTFGAPKLSASKILSSPPFLPSFDHHRSASLYIEIALRPNQTHAFAFHRRRSLGKLLSPSSIRPSHLLRTTCLGGPRFKIPATAEIARVYIILEA